MPELSPPPILPMLSGPALWLGGACIMVASVLLLSGDAPVNPPRAATSASAKIVVELGIGDELSNLVTLARAYPNAKVYGIDYDKDLIRQGAFNLRGVPEYTSGRIELITADYVGYSGPLQHKADVVVSVAPSTIREIEKGVANFARPGGTVEMVFNSLDSSYWQHVTNVFQTKPGMISHKIKPSGLANAPSVMSMLGVPLSSGYFRGDVPEIYIPIW